MMRGFYDVPGSLVGTDDRTSRFVENHIRASLRAGAGAEFHGVRLRRLVYGTYSGISSGVLLPHPYKVFGDECIKF